MGWLSGLGSLVGSYFGPVGSFIGGAAGSMFDEGGTTDFAPVAADSTPSPFSGSSELEGGDAFQGNEVFEPVGSSASSMPSWMGSASGAFGDLLKNASSSPGLAGLASGAASFASARETNEAQQRMWTQGLEFNAQQANLNRDFQKDMSSSSWQRGVADMKAAGINPILAASRGGASTPGGASASSPSAPSLRSPAGEGIASASLAAGTAADLENKAAQNQVLKSQALLNTASASKVQQEELTSRASAGEISERTREITQRLDTLIDARNQQWWTVQKLSQETWLSTKENVYGFSQAQANKRAAEQLDYARASLARTDAEFKKVLAQLSGYDINKARAYSDAWNDLGEDFARRGLKADQLKDITQSTRNIGLRLPNAP